MVGRYKDKNFFKTMEAQDGKKNAGWGGPRAGAGRKRTNHGKYYGFYSTLEVERVLESLASSKTEFINEAITLLAKEKGML